MHLRLLLLFHFMHRLIKKVVLPCRWFIEHTYNIHEGGFARTARAHDGEKLALLHFKISPFQNKSSLKSGIDVLVNVF